MEAIKKGKEKRWEWNWRTQGKGKVIKVQDKKRIVVWEKENGDIRV